MILLDTHVFIWYLDNPALCSKKVLNAIQVAQKKDAVFVSSMSIWEITMLVKKGRLEFKMDVGLWIKKSEQLSFLNFIPVDNDIAYHSVTLPQPLHNDPVDRLLIATARMNKWTIITKDEKILNYRNVTSIW